MKRADRSDNLREACIQEALRIIETDGVEHLSMREVARRLGISHQAPYKHFASRDHVLAEIVRRCFDDFAAQLEARPHTVDPQADLSAMGAAYVGYAADHPLQYRLMFGTPLPDPAAHPEMMEQARRAFSLLRDAIARARPQAQVDLDALYVWSTLHGLAAILELDMFDTLTVAQVPLDEMVRQVIGRIGTGLEGSPSSEQTG